MAKGKTTRRGGDGEELNITSMMDMMTIILVFLLKSYGQDDIAVAPSEDLQLPISTSNKTPKLAVNVVVSQRDVLVDGEAVLLLEEQTGDDGIPFMAIPDSEKRGALITKLHEKLEVKAEAAKALGDRTNAEEFDFQGEVLLQCDKRLTFEVIREVMFTAGQAQFANFRFIVIKGAG